MDSKERYGEDFDAPEYISVNLQEYYNMQENLEYYKALVRMIEEEIESEEDNNKKLDDIKEYLEQLKGVLHK